MYVAVIHAVGFTVLMTVYWWTLVRGSTTSYMASPLWLDIPIVSSIIGLQVVSIACLVAWVVLMRDSTSTVVYGASIGYYALSLLWPFLAKRFVAHPNPTRALLASVPLWGAGACTVLLLDASPDVPTRVLMVPVVVLTVVCDAILWTLAALRKSRQ